MILVTFPRVCFRLLVLLTVSFTLLGIACGAASAQDTSQLGMRGTVGKYPIAMIATLENNAKLVSIHYSYASERKIIPLTGEVDGSTVRLSEPSGAVFNLHFVSSQSASKPQGFYFSTGLRGTWSNDQRHLPVHLTFVMSRDHLKDCIFYPQPPASNGPHFPEPGCEHTPDKAALDKCIAQPFNSSKASIGCIETATRTCRSDQQNTNFCAANINSYLDQTIERRLRNSDAASMDMLSYQHWDKEVAFNCKATSDFGPDGSGYNADIAICIAGERLRLIQKSFNPSKDPIRAHQASH